jgi:putative chitinase
MLTQAQLQSIFPSTSSTTLANIVDPLNQTLIKYQINTKQRICCFLAQAGHESGSFNYFKENLNYSAQGLLATFPHYFNSATAAQYARQPERIANHVYANRMGNGDENSGDGWKFRGTGYIQLTGKHNQLAFINSLQMTIDTGIMYLNTYVGAMMSAGWFWNNNNCNTLADANNFTQITQVINGGQNGAADRLALYNKALSVLPDDITVDQTAPIVVVQPVVTQPAPQPAAVDTSSDGSPPSVVTTIIAQAKSILSRFGINL